jgi:hypothetical protein
VETAVHLAVVVETEIILVAQLVVIIMEMQMVKELVIVEDFLDTMQAAVAEVQLLLETIHMEATKEVLEE